MYVPGHGHNGPLAYKHTHCRTSWVTVVEINEQAAVCLPANRPS